MRRETVIPTGVAAVVVVLCAYLLSTPQTGNLQLVAAALLLLLYLGVTLVRPALGLMLLSATTPFLGVLRRVLYQQSPTGFDPLLLVIPIYSAFMLLAITVTHREKFHALLHASMTARLLLALMGILALQIVNPLQGGLTVGLAGALFYLVPLVWFFIGRVFLTEQTTRRLLTIFVVASIAAAAYGLMQTFVVYPSFDIYWITQNSKSYQALSVNGFIRALGPTTSAAEYAGFLSSGLACLFALVVFKRRLVAVVPAILLGTALVLESSRGAVLSLVVIAGALLALRQKSKPVALIVIGLLCLGAALIYWRLGQAVYTAAPSSSAQLGGFLSHQINGLAHPLDQKYSTGQLHFQEILNAFATSLHNPLGFGLGATTLATAKFGATALSAELDIPNVFLSGGLIAGILYAIILYRFFRDGARVVFRDKHIIDVMAFAIVAVAFGQILNGSYYSLMPFLWMFIAWIDSRAAPALALAPSKASYTVRPTALRKPSLGTLEIL
jgi:hypothetical protein